MLFSISQSDLVSELRDQIEGRPPTRSIMRRLNRQGRKEAKRSVPVEGVRDILAAAVDEAMSLLGSDFLEQREGRLQTLNHATVQCQLLRAKLDQLDQLDATQESEATPAEAPTAAADLTGQLRLYRRQRLLEAMASARDELQEAETARETAEQALPELAARFRQRCETCIAAGRVLWKRYSLGYLWGLNRPGSTSLNPLDEVDDFKPVLPDLLTNGSVAPVDPLSREAQELLLPTSTTTEASDVTT